MRSNAIAITSLQTGARNLKTVLVTLLLAWTCLPRVGSAEMLNGVASYVQSGREYYTVALYTDRPIKDAETALALSAPMRAELHVVRPEWVQRGFNQVWMRDLAMNNEMSGSSEVIEALTTFANFPKAPLVTGDQIEFDYSPGTGTRIRFNGQIVVKGDDEMMFRYLLKTWVGTTPPSRQFRENLLAGGVKGNAELETLLARHEKLTIAAGREGLLKTWNAEEERIAQEAEAARLREIKAAEEKARKKDEEEEARKVAAKREAEEKAAAANAAKVAAEAQAAAAAKAAQAAQEQARLEAEKAAQAAQAAEKARKEEASKSAGKADDKQRDAMVQQYQQSVRNKISGAVVYPLWAKKNKKTGDVTISVKVTAAGGVSSVKLVDGDRLAQLNDALIEAANRAAPFGPIPKELGVATMDVRVTHQFKLP